MKLKTVKTLDRILAGVFVALIVVAAVTRKLLFGYLSIGAAAVIVAVNIVLWRCPYCKSPLGQMDFFKTDRKYCRSCGKKLDL